MKIWLLQDHLRSGGTERQTILLAHAFVAAGHAVEVVAFRPGGALAPTLGPLASRALQPFDTTLNWFAPGLLRAARRAAPDVILCMGRMANSRAGRLARALPATTVVATMRTGKPLPASFRRGLADVAHVVANSAESAARLTREHAVPPTKISVIHNALVFAPADDHAAEAGRPLRAKFGATPDTVVLLCVGMFRPEKNQAALIRLASRMRAPDWQLWLVGDGPELDSCRRLAASLGLAERVRFPGFLSDPAAAYRSALASRAESLSNFLIEAQAHGLPCVAAEAGGVRECCLPGVTGDIAPADDQEAFLAALRGWMDPERRRHAAPLARAFAREAFHPARQAGAYLKRFDHLRSAISGTP
jgi:glycosyltransferase involved in cell wall biosynthesis